MRSLLFMGTAAILAWACAAKADLKVVFEHKDNDESEARFRFKTVPAPAADDLATKATLKILSGDQDPNSPGVEVLHDGKLPAGEDAPRANFFFRPGTDGGRILVDLGKVTAVKRVNTYSWHAGTRGPQVYRLFLSDGKAEGFIPEPARPADPEKCGWQRAASIDTRPASGEPGGQYAVSIFDPAGNLGTFRYLLLDISRTEDADPFGNTFYSEIDIIDPAAPEASSVEAAAPANDAGKELIETAGNEIRLDSSDTPDLTEWVHTKVGPMAQEWYPKIATLLASDGYEPPKKLSIIFDSRMRGVAATGGTRVRCAAGWFRENLQGEAVGAVFHELVHVVQQYGHSRNLEPDAERPPGWLVEGIADYVRWYVYEPQSHGCEITQRNLARARYDGNYRITANFLNWVTETYDKKLVPRLNAAIRQGKYREALWQEYTGHPLAELGADWKTEVEKKVAEAQAKPEQPAAP